MQGDWLFDDHFFDLYLISADQSHHVNASSKACEVQCPLEDFVVVSKGIPPDDLSVGVNDLNPEAALQAGASQGKHARTGIGVDGE